MTDLKGRRVLITGAAQGIGRAMAFGFAAHGAELIVTDIVEDALKETAEALRAKGYSVQHYLMDVTDPQAIRALHDKTRASGKVNVLVNNAGIVFGGEFTKTPLDRHLQTYRVNILGLVMMTHEFLPDLVESDAGHLVNIASASGMIGLPFGSTYASTKWGVIGFSESIRLEMKLLKNKHVKVTTVCPSYIRTGLFDGAKAPLLTPYLETEAISRTVVNAVRKNKTWVLAPWIVKTIPLLKGLCPTPVVDWVAHVLGVSSSMVNWRGRT